MTEKEVGDLIKELDRIEAEFRAVMVPGCLVQIKEDDHSITRITRLNIIASDQKEALEEEEGADEGEPWELIGDTSGFSPEQEKAYGIIVRPGNALLFLGYHLDPTIERRLRRKKREETEGPNWASSDHDCPAWLVGDKLYIGWIDPRKFTIINNESPQ